ncbi:MAG: hypothetical protein FWC77_01895 [Defluviitaleaceae bacterium]|nr:hypothetical protein [Defluviitaleaceae bacterium]
MFIVKLSLAIILLCIGRIEVYMGIRIKLIKNTLGIIGFGMVIVLSFFIISDVEKTLNIGYGASIIPVVYVDMPEPLFPVYAQPAMPRPPAVPEPVPRINIIATEGYFAQNGYPLTAFVMLGEQELSFHLAEDVNADDALITIHSIMEVFDMAYEAFAGRYFYEYFLVAGSGNISARRINYNLANPFHGTLTYLYFAQSQSYPLPKWLCMGLENYLMGSGNALPLSNEDLAEWLGQDAGGVPFGDAWLVSSLSPVGVTYGEILNAAYTLVRRWSQAGELYNIVRLAQADTRAFAAYLNDYIGLLTGCDDVLAMHFLYKFGAFDVMAEHGEYRFVIDGYVWTLARIVNLIEYMDAAIGFVSYRFAMGNTDSIRVTLYPFGAGNVPDAIAEMADMFDWEANSVNFVSGDKITLAGVARFGPWAISHEVAHILLFREFPEYRPPTWVCEGMAVLGEILFRDAFEGIRPYRFSVPMLSNIDALSRSGAGHTLPLFYGEAGFGRNSWTYDDAGSFVLYLYNNYGIEALLEMFRTDNYSQFDRAVEIFGKGLEELMYSWREFLWPNGEPADWWSR